MAFPKSVNALIQDVSQTFADAARQQFGHAPLKVAGNAWGVTPPTARKAMGGELSRTLTTTFLSALASFDMKTRRQILRPLVGDMPEADEFDELEDIRRRLSMIEEARVLRRADAAVLGEVGKVSVAALEGFGALRRGEGGQDRGRPRVAESLSLVQTIRPLDGTESPELAKHLTFSNVVSLDAARNYKRAHLNTGLAWKQDGRWLVEPSPENRLWAGATGPVPLSAFPFPNHVETLARAFEECVASGPQSFIHAGFLNGEHIHAGVLRVPANAEVPVLLAAHVRRA